jgi:hypothetical protein
MNSSQNINNVKINENMCLVITINMYNIVLNCEHFLTTGAV